MFNYAKYLYKTAIYRFPLSTTFASFVVGSIAVFNLSRALGLSLWMTSSAPAEVPHPTNNIPANTPIEEIDPEWENPPLRPITKPVKPGKIYAHLDADILNACPQITEVQTTTIGHDISLHEDGTNNSVMQHITHTGLIEDMHHPPTKQLANFFKDATNFPRMVYIDRGFGGLNSSAKIILENMRKEPNETYMVLGKKAASASTFIAFGATVGKRYAMEGSEIIVHAARDVLGFKKIFEEDYVEGSFLQKNLIASNHNIRKMYHDFSTTGVGRTCMEALIQGKQDYFITPETALKMGWIDVVYRPTDMLVREGDFRAAASYVPPHEQIMRGSITPKPEDLTLRKPTLPDLIEGGKIQKPEFQRSSPSIITIQ